MKNGLGFVIHPGREGPFKEDWRAERPPGVFLGAQRSLRVESAFPTQEGVEGTRGRCGQTVPARTWPGFEPSSRGSRPWMGARDAGAGGQQARG